MRRILTPALLLAALTLLSSCGPNSASQNKELDHEVQAVAGIDTRKVRVVATTNFVSDLVRNVGGDRVKLTPLMGPGVDPHLYKASAGDVDAITESDAVFYVSEELEAKLIDVLKRSRTERAIVAVSSDIPKDRLLTASEDSKAIDPHIWFDTDLWATAPAVVARTLGAIDPENATGYLDRADKYAEEIRAAGARTEQELALIPKERRVLITSHDAFRYFGRRFDIEVEAIQGISTAAEATTRDIRNIAQLIADRKIPTVYVESSVPPRTIDSVIAAAKQRGAQVKVGGELYSDAAGQDGKYLSMLEHNTSQIVKGLK